VGPGRRGNSRRDLWHERSPRRVRGGGVVRVLGYVAANVLVFVVTVMLYVLTTEVYPWVNCLLCYLRLLAGISGCMVPIP